MTRGGCACVIVFFFVVGVFEWVVPYGVWMAAEPALMLPAPARVHMEPILNAVWNWTQIGTDLLPDSQPLRGAPFADENLSPTAWCRTEHLPVVARYVRHRAAAFCFFYVPITPSMLGTTVSVIGSVVLLLYRLRNP